MLSAAQTGQKTVQTKASVGVPQKEGLIEEVMLKKLHRSLSRPQHGVGIYWLYKQIKLKIF